MAKTKKGWSAITKNQGYMQSLNRANLDDFGKFMDGISSKIDQCLAILDKNKPKTPQKP